MIISRRLFLSTSSAAFLCGGPAAAANTSSHGVMVYDPALVGGTRFADRVRQNMKHAQPIEGDRIRFSQSVLSTRPDFIAGVSRGSDYLLITDAARDQGFKEVTRIQHRSDNSVDISSQKTLGDIRWRVMLAKNNWPEHFADFLCGETGNQTQKLQRVSKMPGPMICWIVQKPNSLSA